MPIFQILFKEKNALQLDNKPLIFDSIVKANTVLREHFKCLNDSKLDYRHSDYKIAEVR